MRCAVRVLLAASLLASLLAPIGCSEKKTPEPSDPKPGNGASEDPAKSDPEKPVTPTPVAPTPGSTTTDPPKNVPSPPVDTTPGVVIGRVEEITGPVSGLLIQLKSLDELIQGRTDAAGEFILNDVPPGDYVLNVVDIEAVATGLMRMKTRGVTVGPGELIEENFEIGTGVSVRGRVSGVDGDLTRILVSILRPGAPELTGTQLGDQGPQIDLAKFVEGSDFLDKSDATYEVIDIPPGTYELRIQVMPDPSSSRSNPWPAPIHSMRIEVGEVELEENIAVQ